MITESDDGIKHKSKPEKMWKLEREKYVGKMKRERESQFDGDPEPAAWGKRRKRKKNRN